MSKQAARYRRVVTKVNGNCVCVQWIKITHMLWPKLLSETHDNPIWWAGRALMLREPANLCELR